MKIASITFILLLGLSSMAFFHSPDPEVPSPPPTPKPVSKGCVFNTVMGIEPLDPALAEFPEDKVSSSLKKGLDWLQKAQHKDGGWGAGFHFAQHVRDPHAVPPDPATTAMVAMALLRTGSTLETGPYRKELKEATYFLLKAVETTPPDGRPVTNLVNTQIQRKLGTNIDLVLTTQYFANLLTVLDKNDTLYERIDGNLNSCVDNLQQVISTNGATQGAGWAGVLQSAFANNALEAAQVRGAWVNEDHLERSRDYQKGNYDPNTGRVSTTDGAGVVLYSVTSSVRATAKEARKTRELYETAIKEGLLQPTDELTLDNLVKIGLDKDKALKFYAAYKIYESAKIQAQSDQVTKGFGNNGGEEFLSFLQTGESLIINNDETWKNWFTNVSGQLLSIQNGDGSWNGHHCITSPVFCTATSVLILSVNNDIDELLALGEM